MAFLLTIECGVSAQKKLIHARPALIGIVAGHRSGGLAHVLLKDQAVMVHDEGVDSGHARNERY